MDEELSRASTASSVAIHCDFANQTESDKVLLADESEQPTKENHATDWALTESQEGAHRPSLLLLHDPALIASLWPAERILAGLRVCTSLRCILLEYGERVLCQCRAEKIPASAVSHPGKHACTHLHPESIATTLTQFLNSNVQIELRATNMVTFGDFSALFEGVQLSGRAGKLTALDLAGTQLGFRCGAYGHRVQSRAGETLGEVLRECGSLRRLRISCDSLYPFNSPTAALFPAVRALAACPCLTALQVDGPLDARCAGTLAEALGACSGALRSLVLGGAVDEAPLLAPALQRCSRLTHLACRSERLGLGSLALARCTTLTHLDVLMNRELEETEDGEMAGYPALERLELEPAGYLHTEEALRRLEALPRCLERCPRLTSLDLSGSLLGPHPALKLPALAWDGVGLLEHGLRGRTHQLRTLKLAANALHGEACEALGRLVAECGALQVLDVSGSMARDAGLACLAQACRRRGPRAAPLALHAAYNGASAAGAEAVAAALREGARVRGLALGGNEVGERGAVALAEAARGGSELEWVDLHAARVPPAAMALLHAALRRPREPLLSRRGGGGGG